MTRLHLELLGGFSARLDGGRPCSLPTRKAQALLAYLALPAGQYHSRDKLTALLWGDTAEVQARQSFRQALAAIRRAIGDGERDVLLVRGDTVALGAAGAVVDVAAFEASLAHGSAAALAQAAALYKGDLLDGFALDEAAFDEWRVVERERLHDLALDGLARLLRIHVDGGQVEEAISIGRRLLALDPLQEAVHRAVMRLLLRQGRRGAALRQYQECVASLQRELGAEPEEETRALYREILRGAPADREGARLAATAGAAAPERPAVPAADGPTVGRLAELETLRTLLDSTADDGARVVLVSGEAGIGKTRLIRDFTVEAGARGRAVLTGWCHETEQPLPFRPWIDALRGPGGSVAPRVPAPMSAASRAWLARLFPELAGPGPPQATTADEHGALFEALGEVIEQLGAQAPLVVVLEDLHWADAMSVRLLAFLGRRLGRCPVFIVASMRSEDTAEPQLLGRALGELRSAGVLAEIHLTPLSREDTLALARALVRSTPRTLASIEAKADALWSLSEGNPFVVVEIVRAASEAGADARRDRFSIPPSIRASVLERLARLSEPARCLAAAAAIIGRPASFGLLATSTGLGDLGAAGAVEELVRRRVLETAGDRLTLCHDRLRQVIHDDLLPARRIAVHAAVARALETLHAGRLDEAADELGRHFLRAREPEKALTYLERFAEIAARRYALDAAIDALRQAAEAVDALPEPARDRRRLELALRQAFVLSLAGRHDEALALLQARAAVQRRVADPALASDYHFRLAIHLQWFGRYVDGRLAAEAAVRAAERAGDPARQGKALYALSLMSIATGAISDALAQATSAARLLAGDATRHWQGLNYWSLTWANLVCGRLEAALKSASECLALAETTGDRRLRAMGAYIEALVHVAYGDTAAAHASATAAMEAAADPIATSVALLALGFARLAAAQAASAIEAFRGVFDSRPASVTRLRALGGLAEAHLLLGQLDAAAGASDEVLAGAQAEGAPFLVGWAQRTGGRIALAAGDAARAAEGLARAVDTLLSGEAHFEAALTRLDLARALAAQGATEPAQRQIERALRVFGDAGAHRRELEARTLACSLGLAAPAAPARPARG